MKTPKIEKRPGVYQITNLVNGHRYIGSSVDVHHRLQEHRRLLSLGKHGNRYLQNAYIKYGKDNFIANVLLYCEKEETIAKEQEFLDRLNPEYNIAKNAAAPMLGLEISAESRAKISEALRGKSRGKPSEEHRAKLSKAKQGRKLTKEHKANMSKALKGRKLTTETKTKISEARKGIVLSEETKTKISASCKAAWQNKERKAKRSEASKERWQDEEYRAKMSKMSTDVRKSEEFRAMIGEKSKKMWQERKANPEAMAEWKAKVEASKQRKKEEQNA